MSYQLVFVTFKLYKFPGVLHLYLFDWYGNSFHIVFVFVRCLYLLELTLGMAASICCFTSQTLRTRQGHHLVFL